MTTRCCPAIQLADMCTCCVTAFSRNRASGYTFLCIETACQDIILPAVIMYFLVGTLVLCASFFPPISSASSCTDLDADQFGQCTALGINHTSANLASNETADVVGGIITKFQECSPELVNLMACSLNVPKCRGESDGRQTVLPCRKVCDTFVSQCVGQNGTEFVRKLCPLLPLNGTCLEPSDFKSNLTGSSSQSCSLLSVRQCTGLGYNVTSQPPSVQQILQESELMASIENASTAVRRLVCVELMPPCFPGERDKLVAGCRDSCLNASQNHSEKFLEVFKTTAYCDGLPDHRLVSREEFCFRSKWPQSGFWSEGLRWAFGLQEPPSTSLPTTNVLTATPMNANGTTTKSTAAPSISTTEPTTGANANVSTTNALMNVTTGAPPVTDANISTNEPSTMPKNSTIAPTSSTPTDTSANVTTVPPNASSSTNEPTTMQRNSTAAPPTTQNAGASTAETTVAPTTKPPINTTAQPRNETTATTPTANSSTANLSSSTEKPRTTAPPARSTAKTTSKSPPVGSRTMGTATKPSAAESPTNTGKGDIHARKDALAKSGLSAGAIAGVAIGAICGVVLLIALAIFIVRRRRIAMQYTHRVMVDMDDL